jgi:glucose uptake protein
MFVLESYWLAVVFCVVTMLCWGSWANTQKAAGKTWRFELFYWDYAIGVLLMALLVALTLGTLGEHGRTFMADLMQADPGALLYAFLGGVVFNAANILLVAAIAVAGMAVAFPVGIGLALVLGVLINYLQDQRGDPVLLFVGVALVAVAIVLDAMAYRRLPSQGKGGWKGLGLSIACGVLMSLFYFLVMQSMAKVQLFGGEMVELTAATVANGVLQAGKLTPYTANVVFAFGIFASTFLFGTIIMRRPVEGEPVTMRDYFRGTRRDHLWGLIGGGIWAVGMSLNVVAANVATPAVSYGLGQGATMIAAIWGVFVWREFRDAPPGTGKLLALMFLGYLVGLALVIAAKIPGLAIVS